MKNKIIILRKIGEKNYTKLGETKFKDNEDLISWKEHKIPKPYKNPYTFSTKKVNILFFDIDLKQYIKFEKVDLGLSTEFLGKIFGRKIISQLIRAVKKASQEEKTSFDFIKQGMIIGACLLIGYLIGSGGFF